MLLIDSVKYESYTPIDEDELEKMAQEHAKDIFGPDSIYFDLKHKLKGSSVAAIPDSYAITFNPDQWWIVEVELSTHDLYTHIQNQVGRFRAALPQPNTKSQLRDALWQDIREDEIKKISLKGQLGDREIHEWLTNLVTTQEGIIAIIIDKKVPQLDDAIRALGITPKVIEFVTYTRENVGLAVHAHSFEPVFHANGDDNHGNGGDGKDGKRITLKDLLNVGLLAPNQKIFVLYKGTKCEGQILSNGNIKLQYDSTEYTNLSSAAMHIHKMSWQRVNGWKFWKTIDKSGNEVFLDTIRKSYPVKA